MMFLKPVSYILQLHFPLCLLCSSAFITVLAIFFLSRIVPCLIARFSVTNVGVKFSFFASPYKFDI